MKSPKTLSSAASSISLQFLPFSSSSSTSKQCQKYYNQQQQQQPARFYSSSLIYNNVGTAAASSAASVTDNNSATSTNDEMKDEYGTMDSSGSTYTHPNYVLENGALLPTAQLRYQTYGTLNETRDNVLVICHALTGNASLHSWWGDLLGPQRAFDTDQYYIVCCNILGSCYGSTCPTSVNPMTEQPYGIDFPNVSVQDTVRLQLLLCQEELQIRQIKCVIGGSFGGMQALEYAIQGGSHVPYCIQHGEFHNYVRSCIPIACGSYHTAWQIGISEVQRQAIYKDSEWRLGHYFQATNGLEIARQLGMISYRTAVGYETKFGRTTTAAKDDTTAAMDYGSDVPWQVKNYLEYQGRKFLSRFDPVTYVKLTEQMDSHNIARNRSPDVNRVLQTMELPTLVLGIDSDILYPVHEQQQLSTNIPASQFELIHSLDGHDGFLLEQEQVAHHIQEFLNKL